MSANSVIVTRRIDTTAQMPRTKMSRRRRRAKASIFRWVRGSRVPLIDHLLNSMGPGTPSVITHPPQVVTAIRPADLPLEHAGPFAQDPLQGQQGDQRGEPPPALPEGGIALENPLAAERLQT